MVLGLILGWFNHLYHLHKYIKNESPELKFGAFNIFRNSFILLAKFPSKLRLVYLCGITEFQYHGHFTRKKGDCKMNINDLLQKYYDSKLGIVVSDTRRGELGHIRTIIKCTEALGIKSVDDLKFDRFGEIVQYYLTHTNSKNASINKYIAFLKAALRHNGYEQHPFLLTKKLRDDTSPVKPIHNDDLIDIFRVVNRMQKNKNSHVYKAALNLLYATGCRIGELLNIRIRNINIKHRTILLEKTKSKKERYVFFTEYHDIFILELLEKNTFSPYLFWNHIQNRRLTRDDVRQFHRKLAKQLGLNQLNARQYRKTMATDLAKVTGDNLKMLQTILGHSDIKTTQIYVDYTSEQAHTAYNIASKRLTSMCDSTIQDKYNS